MKKKWSLFLSTFLIALVVSNIISYKTTVSSANSLTGQNKANKHSFKRMPDEVWVRYQDETGNLGCRDATKEEAELLSERRILDQDMRQLNHLETLAENGISPNADGGLKIILRGTPQLDGFPDAKNGFINAAARWEAIIKTPITIVVDVDYGTTRFGTPYPSGVIGSTRGQTLGANDIYNDIRDLLIATASNQQETSLYNSLPAGSLPTDLGAIKALQAPSATLRALQAIDPVADPVKEMSNFGPPPSIGFSSAFSYDFNPADGIDSDKTDFDGVAVHEIGHLLGFTSNVGLKELVPSSNPIVTVWDIFRFRPDVTSQNFTSGSRVLSSGGDQVFFNGTKTGVSTGRPDGSGGDRAQASHWRAKELNGNVQIGVMDPFGRRGQRDEITQNDINAINTFGYMVASDVASATDFSLSFPQSTLTLQRGRTGQFVVNVDRIGGFDGTVMVAPDTTALTTLKIKLKSPSTQSTGATMVTFDFKVKPKALTGNQQVVFTGKDSTGRIRQATLNLVIN